MGRTSTSSMNQSAQAVLPPQHDASVEIDLLAGLSLVRSLALDRV